jgi:hypothetical protein
MEKHTCKGCGKTKPFKEFGLQIRGLPRVKANLRRLCRECAHLQYRDRYTSPRHRKVMQEASRSWKQENPERHAELAREYRSRHPEKIVAQNRLNYAIRKGRVQRQPCEECGTAKRVHAHHLSYKPEDWYNVRWLCYVCHELEHG